MFDRFIQNYQFTLDPDEETIFELRKHWIVLAFKLIKAFFSLLILLIFSFLLGWSRISQSWFLIMICGIWFLVTLVYIFYEWLVWYLDLYILTNKRIVDVEQKTLFSRQISESSLDKIQDVAFEINGFVPTLFNFGNVKIETAGKETLIVLEAVPSPEDIQKTIFKVQEDYKQRSNN